LPRNTQNLCRKALREVGRSSRSPESFSQQLFLVFAHLNTCIYIQFYTVFQGLQLQIWLAQTTVAQLQFARPPHSPPLSMDAIISGK
jgi:hypothetical protein